MEELLGKHLEECLQKRQGINLGRISKIVDRVPRVFLEDFLAKKKSGEIRGRVRKGTSEEILGAIPEGTTA